MLIWSKITRKEQLSKLTKISKQNISVSANQLKLLTNQFFDTNIAQAGEFQILSNYQTLDMIMHQNDSWVAKENKGECKV
jgi:UDP-N-acetyl-D-mannosaminuronate dehydrogenase